ncbi:MAG TPA: aminoglycoside phosphotransferase family protein [Candidatus Bathyarchaeota archaeon]|nr:aminoglycoside phosphotransferase family protein [Candidatus Bathyarchaeota archaeon]
MLIEIGLTTLERYLSKLFSSKVKVESVSPLGKEEKPLGKLKGFGYGVPYLIKFQLKGETRSVVLETVKPSSFGHEHFSDRAQILLWQHSTFNKLPKHVRSIDVGAFTVKGEMVSVGDCREFFILTELVEGQLYHKDLDRIYVEGRLKETDIDRCIALSEYLASIHSKRGPPDLYVRRIRELVGHGECVMGIIDGYPKDAAFVEPEELKRIEKLCVEWRWKLKDLTHRCRQVHGDFHPWNILFREGCDFTVMDRSRGEYGEPADDVTAMTINYLFYSLRRSGKLEDPFKRLFTVFWNDYLEKTEDQEILRVAQPFYAWRALVLASPVWYPTLKIEVRRKLINLAVNLLSTETIDLKKMNSYLK